MFFRSSTIHASIKAQSQMSTNNYRFFYSKTGGQKTLAGGVFSQFLLNQIEIGVADDVFGPLQPQRTLQPLAGGRIITPLDVMTADVGDGVVAIGIERLGAAVKRAGLGVAVQPVQTYPGAQIIITIERIQFHRL